MCQADVLREAVVTTRLQSNAPVSEIALDMPMVSEFMWRQPQFARSIRAIDSRRIR